METELPAKNNRARVEIPDLQLRRFGREIMMGMLECATKYLIILAVVIYAVQWVGNWFDWGVDDSDLDAWNRSGLKIHVDAKTGEEYLSDGRGGLVIRYPTSASKQ